MVVWTGPLLSQAGQATQPNGIRIEDLMLGQPKQARADCGGIRWFGKFGAFWEPNHEESVTDSHRFLAEASTDNHYHHHHRHPQTICGDGR